MDDTIANITAAPPDSPPNNLTIWTPYTEPLRFSAGESPEMILVRLVFDIYINMPLALAGILGNLLSIVVLSNHKPIQTTTVVLESIAVTDTAILAASLFVRSFRYLEIPAYLRVYKYIFVCVYPMTYVLRLANTWLTVLLTVDRYIAVCHPLHAQHLCTLRRTRVLIGLIVVFVVFFTVPRCFEYQLDASIPHGFKYVFVNPWYIFVYRIALFFVVMYLAPMTLLIALNARLLIALRRSQAFRSTELRLHQPSPSSRSLPPNPRSTSSSLMGDSHPPRGSLLRGEGGGGRPAHPPGGCNRGGCRGTVRVSEAQKKKEKKKSGQDAARSTRTITLIAVTVVLVCVVCNISAMVSHVLYSLQEGFKDDLKHLDYYRRYLANYSNLLVSVNSAVNFVIYCVFSRKFRLVLARLVRSRLMRCSRCMRCQRSGFDSIELSNGGGGTSGRGCGRPLGGSGGMVSRNGSDPWNNSFTRQSTYSTRMSVTSFKLTSLTPGAAQRDSARRVVSTDDVG